MLRRVGDPPTIETVGGSPTLRTEHFQHYPQFFFYSLSLAAEIAYSLVHLAYFTSARQACQYQKVFLKPKANSSFVPHAVSVQMRIEAPSLHQSV